MNKIADIASFLFGKQSDNRRPSRCLLVAFFAFCCSFSLTFPLVLEGKSLLYCAIAAVPLFFFVCVAVLLLVHVSMDTEGDGFKKSLRLFCCAAGSLVALWGIAFLVLFPGCFSTDSEDILKMIWGIPFESDWFRYDSLNSHHPAFYIFLNFIAVRFGEVLGFGQMGCASVAAFMHAVTLACCCGFVVCEANKLFAKKIAVLFCWAYFFFDPLLAWYSVTMWKDIIFSGVFVCFALLLAELSLRPGILAKNRWKVVLLILFAVASSLLRSNGFLAVGLSLLVACFVASGSAKKFMVRSTVCVIALFFVVTVPVYHITGVSSAHFAETVGVPLQQISRVAHDGGALSKENEEYLAEILPIEEWRELYNPITPNPLKFSADFSDSALERDKLGFVSHWLAIGLDNPGIYLRAWIAQTQDYWGLNSTTWYTAGPGYDVGDGTKTNSHLGEELDQSDLEEVLSSTIAAFPFLFSIGFLAWSMLGGLLVAFLRGSRRPLLFFLPFVALWATFLLAVPANDFRYMLSLHLAFPLFVLFTFWRFKEEDDELSSEKSKGLSA